jgi:hypothetical protein
MENYNEKHAEADWLDQKPLDTGANGWLGESFGYWKKKSRNS